MSVYGFTGFWAAAKVPATSTTASASTVTRVHVERPIGVPPRENLQREQRDVDARGHRVARAGRELHRVDPALRGFDADEFTPRVGPDVGHRLALGPARIPDDR